MATSTLTFRRRLRKRLTGGARTISGCSVALTSQKVDRKPNRDANCHPHEPVGQCRQNGAEHAAAGRVTVACAKHPERQRCGGKIAIIPLFDADNALSFGLRLVRTRQLPLAAMRALPRA